MVRPTSSMRSCRSGAQFLEGWQRQRVRAKPIFSKTLRLENTRLDLALELANLVGRALVLIEQCAEQSFKIRAHCHGDGGGHRH